MIDPAFPTRMCPDSCITIRDYFAAKAIQGLMSWKNAPFAPNNKEAAEWSYRVADAMMKERGKT